jgi:hypothetical protein
MIHIILQAMPDVLIPSSIAQSAQKHYLSYDHSQFMSELHKHSSVFDRVKCHHILI